MGNILLSGADSRVTVIDNLFIDCYLTKADGEYVKVYLLLWRYFSDKKEITISQLADLLDDTEKDVLRALRYWDKQGLLTVSMDEDREVTEICFHSPAAARAEAEAAVSVSAAAEGRPEGGGKPKAAGAKGGQPAAAAERTRQEKRSQVPALDSARRRQLAVDEEFGQLVYIVGKYLGKPLGATGSDVLGYLYGELHMSADLLEYLVEVSVDAGHKSLHYIEKVALDWHERGIRTVEEARERTEICSRQYYQVLKAFGLSRRGPAPEEKKVMDVWFYEYGFQLDIVVEACNRTIGTIHEPSFEYAGKILADWQKKGVKSRKDIETLDAAFLKGRESGRERRQETAKPNRFHNFDQVGYDYDAIVNEMNGRK